MSGTATTTTTAAGTKAKCPRVPFPEAEWINNVAVHGGLRLTAPVKLPVPDSKSTYTDANLPAIMKKEFVVQSIDASHDGSPYVVVSLASAKDLKGGMESNPPSPYDSPKVMGFTNVNDMMKDLNKMFSGMANPAMAGNLTQIKLDMHEYKDMGLSVGDKVSLELTKDEPLGV